MVTLPWVAYFKESGRDTQCAYPIASMPCSADLVALAIHVVDPDGERAELRSTRAR